MKYMLVTILILISATSIIYAYIKANDAEHLHYEVEELRVKLIEMNDKTMKLHEQTLDAKAQAEMAKEEALRAVLDCQSKLGK